MGIQLTVYSRCMLEHMKRLVKVFFLSRNAFMFLYIYQRSLLYVSSFKNEDGQKTKVSTIKFSKITISIRINLLLQVRPSELSFVHAATCVIFVSSLNVLNCNFYLSRNLVALFPLTEFR